MKVLFITNVPSPYRVSFFNELGKYCELTVLFEKTTSSERDRSWTHYHFEHFTGIVLPGVSIRADMSISLFVCKYLKSGEYNEIVCTDFTSPVGMLAVAYMKKHRIPYHLESDGGFPKDGKGIRECVKRWVISGAKSYFSTGQIHDEYYRRYGASEDRLIRYPFSSVRKEQILSKVKSGAEKASLRKQLGMQEQHIVLTVGQFIYRKGFDLLLKCAAEFDNGVGFYFVGGEPTEEYRKIKENKSLVNVHFVGFRKTDVLYQFYQAADLFVLPTREDIWGLVINEAMANGLPVVTTTRCLAGVEMVKPGENGFLVEPENEQALMQAIKQILCDPAKADTMARNNLKKAWQYTIETMTEKHMEVFGLPGGMTEPG